VRKQGRESQRLQLDGIQKLVQGWQEYIEVEGDSVEKWLCKFVKFKGTYVPFVSIKYLPFLIFYLSGFKTFQPAFVYYHATFHDSELSGASVAHAYKFTCPPFCFCCIIVANEELGRWKTS
jgi:hypothetical protein